MPRMTFPPRPAVPSIRRLGGLAGLALALLPAVALAAAPPPAVEGRSCAWALTIDPNGANAAFPDQAARYWVLDLPAAPGTSLTLSGEFPRARYTSLTTYDDALRSADGLPDLAIVPDHGSVNPFLAGADRRARHRRYSVRVLQGARPAHAPRNSLWTGSQDGQRRGSSFLVALRIYEPDRGLDDTGGVPLPTVEVDGPAGRTVLPGCVVPAAPSGTNGTLSAASGPVRATGESSSVIVWRKFYNLPASFAAAAGPQATAVARSTPKGGFVDNPDNKYVSTEVSTLTGQAVIIHAQLPRTPGTLDGQPQMARADLRYWSLCSNEIATERFWGCVMDDQLPLAADRTYTIVVTAEADRPSNAIASCGIAWLPAGPAADTLLIERNMLPSPAFRKSVQAARYDHERQDLGPFYPSARYARVAQVEALGCHAPAILPRH